MTRERSLPTFPVPSKPDTSKMILCAAIHLSILTRLMVDSDKDTVIKRDNTRQPAAEIPRQTAVSLERIAKNHTDGDCQIE